MKATHTAFVVKNPREGSNEKAQWREVGAIWPQKNDGGFNLVLRRSSDVMAGAQAKSQPQPPFSNKNFLPFAQLDPDSPDLVEKAAAIAAALIRMGSPGGQLCRNCKRHHYPSHYQRSRERRK